MGAEAVRMVNIILNYCIDTATWDDQVVVSNMCTIKKAPGR